MAKIDMTMQALGTEPQTCNRAFLRGELMYAVLYSDGTPAGWHTIECVEHWKENRQALCVKEED